MKKIEWNFIVSIIFVILFGLSFACEGMVVHSLSDWSVGRAYVLRMNDAIYADYEDMDIDVAVDLQEKMLKEKSIRKMTGTVLGGLAEDVFFQRAFERINTKKIQDKIVSESISMIHQTYGEKLDVTPVMKEALQKEVASATDALEMYVASIPMTSTVKIALILYFIVTNPAFRILLGICILYIWYTEAKKESLHKMAKRIGNTCVVSGLLVSGTGILLRIVAAMFTNRFVGRTVTLDCGNFYLYGIELLVVGILLHMWKRDSIILHFSHNGMI